MTFKHAIIILLTLFCLTSCFEMEKPIPPKTEKIISKNIFLFTFDQSIYSSQFYYSLATNQIVKSNLLDDWDLSFESSPKGWHIRLNGGNLLGMYPTEIVDFTTTAFLIPAKDWKYDKSNGDTDTTVVNKWVDISKIPYSYSNKVYLLGKYDGVKYNPIKKFVFMAVTDTSYSFRYADIDNTNLKDAIIRKDTLCNQSFFSLKTGQQTFIEPAKGDWDLLFGQYVTTLYTDKGVPTPYYVRGTLLNSYNVEAALDSVTNYTDITINNVNNFHLKPDWDIIGHNWKAVAIDQLGNTAQYAIRQTYHYIIHDLKGNYYKLKFNGFYNNKSEPGYPSFEFEKL